MKCHFYIAYHQKKKKKRHFYIDFRGNENTLISLKFNYNYFLRLNFYFILNSNSNSNHELNASKNTIFIISILILFENKKFVWEGNDGINQINAAEPFI